ncbi:MAG: DsbE family thiol:disulfide interchange protein [Pseudomonadota bacterium]
MNRFLFLVPLIAASALIGWLAVPLLRGTDPSQLPSALIDQEAPALALPALEGRQKVIDKDGLNDEILAGEVTLLNFFASWCVPCLAEHPILTGLSDEEGVTINAVAYKDRPADTAAWLVKHGDPFALVGVDQIGDAGLDWGLTGVPETFLIDADGRVRYRHIGPLTPTDVSEVLLPTLRALEAE